MTAKEFNRLPLSAKTSIVKDYGKLVDVRKENNDTTTVQTYSVKTTQVERIRFIEVWFEKKEQDISKIKMSRDIKYHFSN